MFDVILGNPPYIKYNSIPKETRDYVKERYKTTKRGGFNFYYAFFELGYYLLSKNGLLVFVTPNNYATLASGEELRELLQKNRCVKRIINFKESKNFEAQTCTAITVVSETTNKFVDYSQIANDQEEKGLIDYKSLSSKRWKLRLTSEEENLIRIERAGQPLHSVFDIRVGLATGADYLYYFSPIEEDDYYYYLNNQFKVEKEITRPCTKVSKIIDIKTDNDRIIFPYDKQGHVLKEQAIEHKFPECWRYLTSIRKMLIRRGKEIKPFYAYDRSQALLIRGMKLLTPSYSKKPHFTLDRNAERYYINGRGLYLKQTQKGLFGQSNQITDLTKLIVYCKILNSCIMDYYVKRNSHIISGGYYSYIKHDIKNFGICTLNEKEMMKLYEMNDQKEVDKFLCNVYNVSCG